MSPGARTASSLAASTSYAAAPLAPAAGGGGGRRRAVAARAAATGGPPPGPPKPNPRFTRRDLRRIKEHGPSVEDLHAHFDVETRGRGGAAAREAFDFVPPEVLGPGAGYAPEPDWARTPRVSYMEFYHGLRRRNWTSRHFDPDAPPWRVTFFADGGRFMRPCFDGYRALVEEAADPARPAAGPPRRFWAELDRAGPDAFLRDYSGGGARGGALHAAKRVPQELGTPAQYGYNQAFEQVFQAHEPRPAGRRAARAAAAQGWVDPGSGPGGAPAVGCPATDLGLLDVAWAVTRPEVSLHAAWEAAPAAAFYAFGVSFLAVALAIGIFRPRRQMPTDMFQALEFAQSKGNARRDGRTGVRFADVGGIGAVVGELTEVVEFLKDPRRHAELGAKPPKGILLSGDPGVGKTLVAKAVAGEAGVPFYQMAGSEFVEAIVGVGAARVRDLFKRARAQDGGCIIFVDEIDALGIRRAAAGVKTNEEREQTLNQLLSEMDGFTPEQGVVFIAATNRPDLLDAALVRAGRFDRKINIRRPDEAGRAEILAIHARRHRLEPAVDLGQLAKDLPGLSGAELGNVLNEAALEAVRRGGDAVSPPDVAAAVDRVLQGIRRPPLPARFAVRRAMAAHEAGAALVAAVLHAAHGRVEAVERVSLVPRGRDWSRTTFARGRDEDYLVVTRGRLLDRLRCVLAGRAAEEVALGGATTYGVSDLRDASRLALRAVAAYGLDARLGITPYAPPPGRLGFMQKSFEVTVDNIDAELYGTPVAGGMLQPGDAAWGAARAAAARLVVDAYDDCLYELAARRAALDAATEALLEREALTGDELDAIIAAHPRAEPAPGDVRRAPDGAAAPAHAPAAPAPARARTRGGR